MTTWNSKISNFCRFIQMSDMLQIFLTSNFAVFLSVTSVVGILMTKSSLFLLYPVVISIFWFFMFKPAREMYTLYGLNGSPYTYKVWTYLKNKKIIPFVRRDLNAIELVIIQVIPLLSTPEGEYLQDSHDIIEFFENRFPLHSVYPDDPFVRFLSVLIAAWADEHWIPATQYYRWTKEKNLNNFQKHLRYPSFVPTFIRKYITKNLVKQFLVGLSAVGVRKEQYHLIEGWTKQILCHLNLHFEQNNFLFDSYPTIGDYGLIGPVELLFSDPFTRSSFCSEYPHVSSWIERMGSFDPTSSQNRSLKIPATLSPIVRLIFQEFIPVINETIPLVNSLRNNKRFAKDPKGSVKCLPRALRQDIQTPYFQFPDVLVKYSFPFHLWKFQKVLDEYDKNPLTIQERLSAIKVENLDNFMKLEIPKLNRVGLNVAFA